MTEWVYFINGIRFGKVQGPDIFAALAAARRKAVAQHEDASLVTVRKEHP